LDETVPELPNRNRGMMSGQKTSTSGSVVWITGLSGAGKSTLARAVVAILREQSTPTVLLDGDEVREVFGSVVASSDNHGRQARMRHGLQYGALCRLISRQGINVVMATISMFREVHAWNRENLPSYTEVFLRVPFEELRRRDPKQIYQRYDAGEITDVPGLDLPVDDPQNPDLTIDFEPSRQLDSIAQMVIQKMTRED